MPMHDNLQPASPSAAARPLEGQVAVVTGASRGLGRAYATAFAEAGAAVVLVARGSAELAAFARELSGLNHLVLPVAADVADGHAVRHAADRVLKMFGFVDLLVNAAGLGMPMGPFADASIEGWWRTIEVNLKGPALWSRALLPAMMKRGHGRIINLASIGAADALSGRFITVQDDFASLTELTDAARADSLTLRVVQPALAST